MQFSPERLTTVREKLGISKAEAARRLNMSAMGYGRYENGDRTPSYQVIAYMAQVLGTSISYLCGESENSAIADYLITSDTPELYTIVEALKNESPDNLKRIIEYIKHLK